MSDATTESAAVSVPNRRHRRQLPALVLLWSTSEPWRTGEVGFLPEKGRSYVVGRGTSGARATSEGAESAVVFARQRPGRIAPPTSPGGQRS